MQCEVRVRKLETNEPKCMKCGKPFRYKEQEYCHDCMHTQHYFDRGAAVWLHKEPVNFSIYQFKYHNQRIFGKYYAAEMVKKYRNTLLKWKPDIIVPIPLHCRKLRKRGYNQSALVAKELGEYLGIAVDTKGFRRVRGTVPQKGLAPAKRRMNLGGAFSVSGYLRTAMKGKTVLLIDDIYTTGSTMDEAARTLKREGSEKVFYLTISIGQGY